jgi:nitroimidazol reductase NimA-like FMN-containing flavoprotein (pyridoxamine 5'-phosphate oxidase superfamily)
LVTNWRAGVAAPALPGKTGRMESIVEQLSEEESLRLAGGSEVGRIGFTGRYGPMILPVNFKLVDGAVVFRTEADSALVEDLRTGIPDAEYRVAFEVDEIDGADRTGWSVMIQGAAHYLEEPGERAGAEAAGIEPWIGGDKETYIRIRPAFVSGRRIRRG